MNNKKNPTMKDVAIRAHVSLGTVSKVINGIPVSQANKIKVEQSIKALNYQVNTYARGLKTQKSNLIALIIPNIVHPFYASLANNIESALYKQGLKLLLCCSTGAPEKELEYLNMVTQNKVDGIIALTYSDIGKHIPDSIPIVAFDRYFDTATIPRVASDNFTGGCLALEKLLELGCKHPIYLYFHSPFPGEPDKRKIGYLYACEKHHIEPVYLDAIEGSQHEIMATLTAFIEKHKRADGTLTFDGIFAQTDYYGYLISSLLRKDGYKIPEDVQIIGFDGINRFGGVGGDLIISSICQPTEALAEKCVEILLTTDRTSIANLTLLPVKFEHGGTTKVLQ